MRKSLTASKNVMKTYLSELLTEPDEANDSAQHEMAKATIVPSETVEADVEPIKPKRIQSESAKPKRLDRIYSETTAHKDNKSLEKLLKTVSEPIAFIDEAVPNPTSKPVRTIEQEAQNNKVALFKEENKTSNFKEIDLLPITSNKAKKTEPKEQEKSYRQGDFQAMFFDVAGLLIAVPLIELGGIHKTDKTTSLMGKPDWFKGVMLYREEKVNIVDTALWVMPEKCDETLKSSLNYQYVIMLKDSNWGLLAENLVDTVVLSQSEVKWLDGKSKRPWLAGLVKEKMCALLDVNALIQLLDKGSSLNQEK